ncbi:M48 family metalloprotease [Psychromonas sp. MME2]|uniref:beta-barrel assembly-enhancing protease n=1 Tax=unclassified Psychromonas TaxID=2614957 RepID=UPI00339CC110
MFKKSFPFSLYLFSILWCSIATASQELPDIGTVGSSALTIDKEKEYGWAFRMMANQALPIIHDPVLNKYIDDLGDNLVAHADSVKLPFHFFLIQDKEINAAAFLGGNVKIHTGLFLYAKNESELASVLAHEIAHITQRHLARMLEQQSINSPTTLAALAGSVLLTLVNPAAGIAALSTSMAVSMQSQINYTRQNEYEADRIGIQTLANAGYDPYGMANFFSKLAEKYKYATMPPQMLLTHPIPETRLAESRLRASQFPVKKVKNNLAYQLSKARIIVRYNDAPAQTSINFYQNQLKNKSYQLEEAAEYGLTLAYLQNKDYEKAHEMTLALLKNNPSNLFFIDLLADTAISVKKPEEAIKVLQAYYKQSPENPVYTLNLVNILQMTKQYQEAEEKLALFIRTHPNNILAHQLAIDLYRQMKKPAKEHASKAQYLALLGQFREASQEMGSALIYADNKLDQARYAAQIENYKKDDLKLRSLQK